MYGKRTAQGRTEVVRMTQRTWWWWWWWRRRRVCVVCGRRLRLVACCCCLEHFWPGLIWSDLVSSCLFWSDLMLSLLILSCLIWSDRWWRSQHKNGVARVSIWLVALAGWQIWLIDRWLCLIGWLADVGWLIDLICLNGCMRTDRGRKEKRPVIHDGIAQYSVHYTTS